MKTPAKKVDVVMRKDEHLISFSNCEFECGSTILVIHPGVNLEGDVVEHVFPFTSIRNFIVYGAKYGASYG